MEEEKLMEDEAKKKNERNKKENKRNKEVGAKISAPTLKTQPRAKLTQST